MIPMNDAGELLLDEYEGLLNERTKLVAVMHVSNALGTINPIKEMIAQAHKYGVPVLIDGAQAAPHMPVDVQDLDCDFYVFSGHKMFAPTGSGVVYGKLEILETMNPFQGGGDMIKTVTFEKTTYADPPTALRALRQSHRRSDWRRHRLFEQHRQGVRLLTKLELRYATERVCD